MNRFLQPLVIAVCLAASALLLPAGADEKRDEVKSAWLRFDRGEGQMPLYVPRAEVLKFDVELDVGVSDLDVGDVELSSGVDPYRAGLPPAGSRDKAASRPQERGWVKSVAKGSYLSYRLEHELKARLLPQAYPMIFYTDSQRGSENRNRELKVGVRDGATVADYRSDGHCKGCRNREHYNDAKWMWSDAEHCKKCKKLEHRVWKAPVTRELPAGTVDMLSAVYLARTLVRENLAEATFPVIDRQEVWEVHLTRGKRKRIETRAGTFECQEIRLGTKFMAGEGQTEDDAGSGQFQGLFGLQGSIQIWLEANTGVPVLIEGELPVPLPFVDKLDVRVRLKSAKGTPPEFRAVR